MQPKQYIQASYPSIRDGCRVQQGCESSRTAMLFLMKGDATRLHRYSRLSCRVTCESSFANCLQLIDSP